MKKKYEAPTLETEIFELDAKIASNCDTVVNNGPKIGDQGPCQEFISPYSLRRSAETEPVYNVNFYDDVVCDCYTTGGNGQYWTS